MNRKVLRVNITEKQVDSPWSWVVCVSSFIIQFLVCGFHNSFGTFFVALLDKFHRSEAETVWIGAVAIGLTYFCGPFSTYLCRRFGCRVVACTGSVLLLISGLLTSIVNQMIWMYLTFGVLNGLASSMLYFSSLYALMEYFHQGLPLANGIAVSGVGVGTLVISIASQNLLSRFGLQMTFRIVAVFSGITFLAGLAYSPIKHSSESAPGVSLKSLEKVEAKSTVKTKTFAKSCQNLFKLGKHWRNKGFAVWCIAMALIMFVCYVPLLYIVRIAADIGLSTSDGGVLIGLMAITQTTGKLIFGKLASLQCANRLKMAQFALVILAVSIFVLPLAKSYTVLLAICAIQGFVDGCFVVLIGLITLDIVGKKLMAGAVGSVYFIISIPVTIGPPIAGVFYDTLGNYKAVFFLSGGLVCAGICITFLVPWLTPPLPLSTYSAQKRELVSLDDKFCSAYHDKRRGYDLSCVDEENLASLFGKSGADLLLDRNRALLDHSFSESQRSSFILFSIVSEENQRDISAYSSHQELSSNIDMNTPNLSLFRRSFRDVESHSSNYSLCQSIAEVPHLEVIAEITTPRDTSGLIDRQVTLETVTEVSEREGKNSAEEAVKTVAGSNMVAKDIGITVEEESVATDVNEKELDEDVTKKDDLVAENVKEEEHIELSAEEKESVATDVNEKEHDEDAPEKSELVTKDVNIDAELEEGVNKHKEIIEKFDEHENQNSSSTSDWNSSLGSWESSHLSTGTNDSGFEEYFLLDASSGSINMVSSSGKRCSRASLQDQNSHHTSYTDESAPVNHAYSCSDVCRNLAETKRVRSQVSLAGIRGSTSSQSVFSKDINIESAIDDVADLLDVGERVLNIKDTFKETVI